MVPSIVGARPGFIPEYPDERFGKTEPTRFFAAGWNVKQVQRVLGHHKASFTIDSYIHLLDEDLPDPSFLDELSEPQGGNKVGTEVAEPDRSPAPRAIAESGD